MIATATPTHTRTWTERFGTVTHVFGPADCDFTAGDRLPLSLLHRSSGLVWSPSRDEVEFSQHYGADGDPVGDVRITDEAPAAHIGLSSPVAIEVAS